MPRLFISAQTQHWNLHKIVCRGLCNYQLCPRIQWHQSWVTKIEPLLALNQAQNHQAWVEAHGPNLTPTKGLKLLLCVCTNALISSLINMSMPTLLCWLEKAAFVPPSILLDPICCSCSRCLLAGLLTYFPSFRAVCHSKDWASTVSFHILLFSCVEILHGTQEEKWCLFTSYNQQKMKNNMWGSLLLSNGVINSWVKAAHTPYITTIGAFKK